MISCHVEFKFCMCTKIRISVFFVTYLSMAQDFSCQSIFFNKLLLLLLLLLLYVHILYLLLFININCKLYLINILFILL